MKTNFPRVMLAAPASGSGKTWITCGILKALQNRCLSCRSFKCGPDYIDMMFHKQVLGIPGSNLDTYFLEAEQVWNQFAKTAQGSDISIIEGVMGYYDGLGGCSTQASSFEVAKAIQAPVILIVDGRKAGLSLAALVKGFLEYQKDNLIQGVILNRTASLMGKRLTPALEALGIRVYGCLPECEEGKLESRHLGLVLPEEIEDWNRKIEVLAEKIEENIDLNGIIALASSAVSQQVQADRPNRKRAGGISVRAKIGVALDEAFCFYYQENLELLKKSGAELVSFSPLADQGMPEGVDGVLLGGGYPELYGKKLSENKRMRDTLRRAADQGMPIVAECGGFLYLHDKLEAMDGITYPMVGIIRGEGYRTGHLVRFGYVGIRSNRNTCYLRQGEVIKGHEFHYWDSTNNGSDFTAEKPMNGRQWDCIHGKGSLWAGFPHLYYPSCPEFADRFVTLCERWRGELDENRK